MPWAATVTDTQLSTQNNNPQLIVTVKLDNVDNNISITAPITLGVNEDRNSLRNKINAITDGIDGLNVVKADLTQTPQVDTSPQVVTDIQQQLNIQFNILNQIQSLVKAGIIAADDNVVTDQIQKFADVANKIIKPQSAQASVIQ